MNAVLGALGLKLRFAAWLKQVFILGGRRVPNTP
jgi:hypothetical protein